MSGRKGNTIKELDSIKGKALKMTKKIKEKRLILVFGFSVDVLNLLLFGFFALQVFCGFKGLSFGSIFWFFQWVYLGFSNCL